MVIGTGLFFLAAAWQFASIISLIAGIVILTVGPVRDPANREARPEDVRRLPALYLAARLLPGPLDAVPEALSMWQLQRISVRASRPR